VVTALTRKLERAWSLSETELGSGEELVKVAILGDEVPVEA